MLFLFICVCMCAYTYMCVWFVLLCMQAPTGVFGLQADQKILTDSQGLEVQAACAP